MSISPVLMRAILAMDVYNRGYKAGVLGFGSVVGYATRLNIARPDGAQSADFYTVAYTLADGS